MHKSTKCTTKSDAIVFRAKYVEEINKPPEIKQEVYLFDFVVNKFLDEKERILKKTTLNLYYLMLKRIVPYFSNRIMSDIKKITIKNYEEFRLLSGISKPFLLKELKLLKSIFNFACENELLEDNLFNNYKFTKIYKDYKPRNIFLTPYEINTILSKCSDNLKDLLIFILETGLRSIELINILYNDIALEPNNQIYYLRIRAEISKNKKERYIPLSPNANSIVFRRKQLFPNSTFIFTDKYGNNYKTAPRKALALVMKKCKLKHISFHIFRHTFASLKLMGIKYNGEKIQPKRIEIISEILGHQSIDFTKKVYAHFDKDSLTEIL